MKLQRTTLLLVLFALLLGAGVYFSELRRSGQPEATNQAKPQQLFTFKEEDIQSFSVQTKQQTLSFARNPEATGQKPENAPPKWQLQSPQSAPADDASVAYLLNLLATGKSQDQLTISAAQNKDFGLDQPLATIEVKLKNQTSHRLILGKPNFNRTGIYAQADPAEKAADLKVLLVSSDFENAVNRPVTEWQKQPTPSPSPTGNQPQSSPSTAPSPSEKPKPSSQTTPSPSGNQPSPTPSAPAKAE